MKINSSVIIGCQLTRSMNFWNTNSNPQPFVLIGNEAFRLHTNLLRPFPQRNWIHDEWFSTTDYLAAGDMWNAHSVCSRINGEFCIQQYC